MALSKTKSWKVCYRNIILQYVFAELSCGNSNNFCRRCICALLQHEASLATSKRPTCRDERTDNELTCFNACSLYSQPCSAPPPPPPPPLHTPLPMFWNCECRPVIAPLLLPPPPTPTPSFTHTHTHTHTLAYENIHEGVFRHHRLH